jgi:lipoprotein-anchoring transpeptidase ErfK/SrfK
VGDWTPYMLHVSIADQRVYVNELQDGKYVQIDEFICSTGYGNLTPTGVFTSTRPLYRWHHFKEYKCYAQYSYQIQGNILFHSILYDRDDVKTLREASLYALGQKASHGCVRLKPEAAKWIFENCEKGTIVTITEN